jgi:hypothetical protein
MVEVKWNPETGFRKQRVDTYTPQPRDVMFRGREITPSDFEATGQSWYQRAVAEDGPGWSMLSHLPYRDWPKAYAADSSPPAKTWRSSERRLGRRISKPECPGGDAAGSRKQIWRSTNSIMAASPQQP